MPKGNAFQGNYISMAVIRLLLISCYSIKNHENNCLNDFKNNIYQTSLSWKTPGK